MTNKLAIIAALMATVGLAACEQQEEPAPAPVIVEEAPQTKF
ncbi:MAG: hypothetical protein AAFQ04_06930 [Pseudomonadota bacterium]